MPQNVHLMITLGVTDVYVYEQSMMVMNDYVVYCIVLKKLLNQVSCALLVHNFWFLTKLLSMKPIQPNNSCSFIPKIIFSLGIGHWISFPNASLMHDLMNNAFSHNIDFD
jgi:hypothetical protein